MEQEEGRGWYGRVQRVRLVTLISLGRIPVIPPRDRAVHLQVKAERDKSRAVTHGCLHPAAAHGCKFDFCLQTMRSVLPGPQLLPQLSPSCG